MKKMILIMILMMIRIKYNKINQKTNNPPHKIKVNNLKEQYYKMTTDFK